MKIAHIGPRLSQTGGPAGYLRQLKTAIGASDVGSEIEVSFPTVEPGSVPGGESWIEKARRPLAKLKRSVFGAPKQFRPGLADCARPNGPLSRLLDVSEQAEVQACLESYENARAEGADVLFTHSPAVARWVRGQTSAEVWLMLHSPIPIALYLAWTWGLPEQDWHTLVEFPDVKVGIDRELETCSDVDRLFIPCSEALGELGRVDRRYQALADRIDYLLTGAEPPGDARCSKQEARRRLSLPDGPLGLLLGSAQPYRGLARLLEASRLVDTDVPGKLAIAGPSPDLIGRGARLVPLGRVSNVGLVLRAVDFLVNTNLFSLFDLSNIEAAAVGKPMLLSDTGGNRTLARLGAGVVSMPDCEPSTIASGLEGMFLRSEDALSSLGERSYSCYREHLSLEALARRHRDFYLGRVREVVS